jgi:hypothetical protein
VPLPVDLFARRCPISILGIDFLRHFKLLVDPAAGTILPSQAANHDPHTAVALAARHTSTAAAVKAPPGSAVAVSQAATCRTPSRLLSSWTVFPKW